LRAFVKRHQCVGHGAYDEPSPPDRSAQDDLLFSAGCTPRLFSCKQQEKEQAAGSRRGNPGTHLVLSWSCIQKLPGAADRGHEKTQCGFPPGAHFVSFNFANTPICAATSTLFFPQPAQKLVRNIFRLAPGQMPESGMLLSPMLRILRRRLI
jgi:hypothetical protein